MSQKLCDTDFQEVLDILLGTTETVEGAIYEVTGNDQITIADLTESQLSKLNKAMFLCVECEWWCKINELATDEGTEEKVCKDCTAIKN